ncbi:MAG TPA: hypothetical protein VJ770_14155 [Stellaceae bacterium]|nr:hypothetical protein [Stellaceae bacterium]
MRLGEILVAQGLVTAADIDAAWKRQLTEGGRLGESLIALGLLTADQLASVLHSIPAVPSALADTGIAPRNLLNLLLKFMHVEACGTVPELADRMKLAHRLIQQLIDDALQQKFLQALGSVSNGAAFAIRYSLTDQGRAAARNALDQNLYLGPAPVCLAAYQQQLQRQRITNELLDADTLRKGFEGLVVPEHYFRKLLPAINAGRTVLLFGPPGNGKTTLATRIATLFRDVVFIPYAVEIGGQIVKVFDPSLHKPSMPKANAAALGRNGGLQREQFDERWIACGRPVAVAGGELTLEMLDLQYNPETKFYDAPLHVKALNGMLLIDDFGRQKFDPSDLLNRWIVPMENQIDYLKLNTGVSFSLPFDELLVFSTNLQPSDLMDQAFLRRIPYKIKLFSPNREEYRQIFDAVAKAYKLTLSDEVFDFIVESLLCNEQFGLAYYQPKFICAQAVEICKSFGLRPTLTKELAAEALANLYFDIEAVPER